MAQINHPLRPKRPMRPGKTASWNLNKAFKDGAGKDPNVAATQPLNAVAATRILAMPIVPANNETITIGTKVYTWKTSGAVANQINIGADVAAARVALVAAINGTDGINTAHPDVTAAAFSGNNMTITAKVRGVAGNSIATTETMAGAGNQWPGTTMTGGVNGTVAEAGTFLFHNNYIYFTATAATISSATWVRSQMATF